MIVLKTLSKDECRNTHFLFAVNKLYYCGTRRNVDIKLDQPLASEFVLCRYSDELMSIANIKSPNDIYINSKKLRCGQAVLLKRNDIINIGNIYCPNQKRDAYQISTEGDGDFSSTSSSTMLNTSPTLVEASLTNPGNLLTSSRRIVMRDEPRFYCTRSISRTNCYNSDVLRHSVRFSVDKNICMMGIEVPTKNNTLLSQSLKGISYCENICVQLLDCNGTELMCI